MMLSAAAPRRALASALSRSSASASRSFGAVASTDSDDAPSFMQHAPPIPSPVTTVLSNGVVVASLYNSDSAGSGASYASVRVSNAGSRSDAVGGEANLLGRILGASEVGREHLSFDATSLLPSLGGGGGIDIDAHEFESAKAEIIREIEGKSQYDILMNRLYGTAFQGSPAGYSLANPLEGTVESVASLTRDDLAARASAGADVCVVGTGNGNHEQLVERAEKAFGGLMAGGSGKAVSTGVRSKPFFVGSDVRVRYDSHKSCKFILAFEGASHTSPHRLPLNLATEILGTYNKSDGRGRNVAAKMCQEVAEHDLADSIVPFSVNYGDTGLFGLVVDAPDNTLDDLLWYAMPSVVNLAHGSTDEEMARGKLALRRRILTSLDGDANLGRAVAEQMQTVGRYVSVAETLARIDGLTSADVGAAADASVNDQDHALAAVGGIHELPDYNWIRRKSYFLRY